MTNTSGLVLLESAAHKALCGHPFNAELRCDRLKPLVAQQRVAVMVRAAQLDQARPRISARALLAQPRLPGILPSVGVSVNAKADDCCNAIAVRVSEALEAIIFSLPLLLQL